jgi:hypothetical protein
LQAEPSLLDPASCGEDLRLLASRMAEIAPSLCVDCATYHIRFAVTRFVAPQKSIALDRPLLIRRIQRILADRARHSDDIIRIVITGAADTGILATCAHAAAALGDDLKARCRFVVLDRCRSPLTLCAEFARHHALDVQTAQVDLLAPPMRFDADLIVLHSFLRFISRDKQIALLKEFATWLRPRGRIIISQSIRPGSAAQLDWEEGRRQSQLALAKAAIAAGAIAIPADAARLLEKMSQSSRNYKEQLGDIASETEFRDLLKSAGLREHSLEVIRAEKAGALGRVRAVAIAGSNREG